MPKPWPAAFSAKFSSPLTETLFGKNTTGTFALVPGLAERIDLEDGSRDHICIFSHNNTPCTQLTVEGFRYVDFPKLDTCCKCCSYAEGTYLCGGPLNGEFLKNERVTTYVGPATVDGYSTDRWEVQGYANATDYYALVDEQDSARNGLPIKMLNPNYLKVPKDRADDLYIFDPNTFSTDVDLATFNVPPRCRDAAYCGTEPCAPAPQQ